jgi:hypothetical protein
VPWSLSPILAILTEELALGKETSIVTSAHEEGSVLLDVATGRMYMTNRIGHLVWERLSAGLNPQAVAAELSERFGISTDLAARHAQAFADSLRKGQLLVPRGER